MGGVLRRASCRRQGLKIECRLNGRVMHSDNTANMMFSVAEALADVTQAMTLGPGDLPVAGTPSDIGHARKPPVWMQPGDDREIEGIGMLAALHAGYDRSRESRAPKSSTRPNGDIRAGRWIGAGGGRGRTRRPLAEEAQAPQFRGRSVMADTQLVAPARVPVHSSC